MGRPSKLHRGDTGWGFIKNDDHGSQHCASLFFALVTLVVHTWEIVSHGLLLDYYFRTDHPGSAAAILLAFAVTAGIHILFDYLNRGRFKYFILDLFQSRLYVEFYHYMEDWFKNRGNGEWIKHEFRPAVSFESFVTAYLSMTIQVYVIYDDGGSRDVDWRQYMCLAVCAIQSFVATLHYFKYVTASALVYAGMCAKAIWNTVLRVILTGLLVGELKLYTLVWIGASYVLGFLIYVVGVNRSRHHKRDDPLHYLSCHIFFGGFVALINLFISFPFAPNHKVTDWWRGYLISDLKISLESAAMCVVVMITIYDNQDISYFALAMFFILTMFLASLVSLYFLNKFVRAELVKRRKYSNGLIVDLFHYIFAYHKHHMAAREQAWQDAALSLITSSIAAPTERQRVHTIHPALTHFDTKLNLMVGPDGKPVAAANMNGGAAPNMPGSSSGSELAPLVHVHGAGSQPAAGGAPPPPPPGQPGAGGAVGMSGTPAPAGGVEAQQTALLHASMEQPQALPVIDASRGSIPQR